MDESKQYIRVGTQYFRVAKVPSAFGTSSEMLIHWDKQTIKDDHGQSVLFQIEKFKGFIYHPNHIDFAKNINGFYNKYQPLQINPIKGEWLGIEKFLMHIFGVQYHLALDYLTLLFNKPTQFLPILCLVSHQQNTGKSTFLTFLQMLFGGNVTVNSSGNFRSSFNDDWLGKLIIAVEEANLCKNDDLDIIKYLSTSTQFKAEGKFKDRVESDFFGKFILISNKEQNFIQIDESETRFWVVTPKPLDRVDPNFLKQLENELPHFIQFIAGREPDCPDDSRLWFDLSKYENEALRRLKKFSRARYESELLHLLQSICDEHSLEEIKFTLSDASQYLKHSNFHVEKIHLKDILTRIWKLKPADNSLTYIRYAHSVSGSTHPSTFRGRYFQMDYEQIVDRLK